MVKNLPANTGDARDTGSIPGLERTPGVENGNSLQYTWLENSIGRGAWRATVWGVMHSITISKQIPVVLQSLSHVQLFVTPWTAAHQASLSFTITQSLLRLTSIESVMPSNQLILCRPLLLPPSISPSIRVFPNESVLRFRWPQDWSFSFSLSPSSEYSGPISHWSVVAFQYGVSFSAVNQL